MCSRKKVFLIVLLICLLPSLAFCGAWEWCKPSADGSSGSCPTLPVEATTPVCETSPTEDMPEEKPIEEVSKNCEESAVTYDETLTEMKDALEEVRNSKAKDQALAIVDQLIEDKAKDDENYEILAETAKAQEKEIEHLKKETDGVHFGLGFSMGYNYISTISPGLDMQLRVGNWIFNTSISYSIDCLGNITGQIYPPDPTKIQTRIGIMYEF